MEFCDGVGTIAGGLAIGMAASVAFAIAQWLINLARMRRAFGKYYGTWRQGTAATPNCVVWGRGHTALRFLQIGSFDDEILALERAWKLKLMTREFGLNGNSPKAKRGHMGPPDPPR